ncbi:tyrosine recombinase XerC [Steroidobacter sp.]|uniref:tyrosine recombinase XerC n=1 Tax=Steroidobacter sp. TaxID=1978227 RepID=UPI001A4782AC|nr:tyrosine recombinase XerC [Steroidobacter sp.]MBL8264768.1 tyrosine recombinase XerC [Steroidobacter sp.]
MHDSALARLPDFFKYLSVERRMSPHTDSNYRRDLKRFVSHCDRNSIAAWERVDGQHVRSFAATEHRQGASPRTIQRRLSAIRSFYNYLLREGAVKLNPAVDVQAPKAKKRLPATIDVDQMARLLSFRTDEELSVRDKAIMELFYSSGLRLSELVSLDLEDVDLADRTVRVLGKGKKMRIVPVGKFAAEAIVRWRQERTKLAAVDSNALFVSIRGDRISHRSVQKQVGEWAKRQGLGVHVHPHMFRHSFASHLLESSHNLRGVQELLGHANIATTQIYTHLDFQHLAKIYDAAHPRARRKT